MLSKEFQQMTKIIKEASEENNELQSTLQKSCRDFDSFKKSTNFRISLYQSKEQKNLDKFFSKHNSSSADPLIKEDLEPMKEVIEKLRSENTILKK